MKTNSQTYRLLVIALLCIAAPFLIGARSVQAQSISDLGSWDGTSSVGSWGSVSGGSTPTYGQTFQASVANSSLKSITFYIQNSNVLPVNFFASVYAWNGSTIVSSALFVSPTQTVLGTGMTAFQAIAVNVGALGLVPGSEYIAIYSTIGQANAAVGGLRYGALSSNPIANSLFAFNNTSTDFDSGWAVGIVPSLAFDLEFNRTSAVPENGPGLALVGLAIGGLIASRRLCSLRLS